MDELRTAVDGAVARMNKLEKQHVEDMQWKLDANQSIKKLAGRLNSAKEEIKKLKARLKLQVISNYVRAESQKKSEGLSGLLEETKRKLQVSLKQFEDKDTELNTMTVRLGEIQKKYNALTEGANAAALAAGVKSSASLVQISSLNTRVEELNKEIALANTQIKKLQEHGKRILTSFAAQRQKLEDCGNENNALKATLQAKEQESKKNSAGRMSGRLVTTIEAERGRSRRESSKKPPQPAVAQILRPRVAPRRPGKIRKFQTRAEIMAQLQILKGFKTKRSTDREKIYELNLTLQKLKKKLKKGNTQQKKTKAEAEQTENNEVQRITSQIKKLQQDLQDLPKNSEIRARENKLKVERQEITKIQQIKSYIRDNIKRERITKDDLNRFKKKVRSLLSSPGKIESPRLRAFFEEGEFERLLNTSAGPVTTIANPQDFFFQLRF